MFSLRKIDLSMHLYVTVNSRERGVAPRPPASGCPHMEFERKVRIETTSSLITQEKELYFSCPQGVLILVAVKMAPGVGSLESNQTLVQISVLEFWLRKNSESRLKL